MFKGTYTAIITPFLEGEIDESSLSRLIKSQIKAKVDGIVPVGTTGESPTLDFDEHIKVVEIAVKLARSKIKVMAGTGANSTQEAVELTKAAEMVGADASLQVAPYYNKPTQAGLIEHFSAIASATSLPIILYSIPGRCGIEIAVETVKALALKHRNIVGIKEAGGQPDRVSALRRVLGPNFSIFSGDDSLTLPFLSVGANGVISVASNLIPSQISQMVNSFLAGQPKKALRIHSKYYPLFKDLFVETNPVPIKCALHALGFGNGEPRLPLVKLSENSRSLLLSTMKEVGLLRDHR